MQNKSPLNLNHILYFTMVINIFLNQNAIGQSNIWQIIEGVTIGQRSHYSLNYLSKQKSFIVNIGTYSQNTKHPHTDLVFNEEKQDWMNYLPDSLYGILADSYGNTLQSKYSDDYYFDFKSFQGLWIPQLIHQREAVVHRHYALDTDNEILYFYINGLTFSYNPKERNYHLYQTDIHPALIDIQGNIVLNKYTTDGNKISFDISNIPNGTNFINLKSKDVNYTKFI